MSITRIQPCVFCGRPSDFDDKCAKHRYRLRCSVENCPNQTYARNLCVQHGGKQQCRFQGCNGNARRFGFCCKHGVRERKPCSSAGCRNISHARGLCVKHGGGRPCKWAGGCTHAARIEGFCHNHYRELAKPNTTMDTFPLTSEEIEMLSVLLKDVNVEWLEHETSMDMSASDNAFQLDLPSVLDIQTVDLLASVW
ncbi:unnamed protein product [Aphanomyces euteiches]|uniref:Uncharacterized protein n=1 Tax=Aphanomyces euteiches TaxID=100861 RepID=A0A6G0X3C7_9STRA|nr:hypothetical protein Ae201684_008860 [Aphanomyces euteiches]KAH9054409.1 hypothetical protein Ae201684P_018130 [Aphanomyces euteiches]KAH9109898.1 hypothetical protein LEN26_013912 [Aphanomyces euteiches]KAH9131945.1 hypothetical protein AeRB84_021508 [Aphanomyces euteiches]